MGHDTQLFKLNGDIKKRLPDPKLWRQKLHKITLESGYNWSKTVLLPQLCKYSKLMGSNPHSRSTLKLQMFSESNANKAKARKCDLMLPGNRGRRPIWTWPSSGTSLGQTPPHLTDRDPGNFSRPVRHGAAGCYRPAQTHLYAPMCRFNQFCEFWFLYGEHRILEGNELKLKQQLAYSIT